MSNQGRYRYPGVNFFRKEDKDIFCGRKDDIEKIYTQVMLCKTLVFHAESGTGKSSLIRAGLLPLMEEEQPRYLSVIVRFDIYNKSVDRYSSRSFLIDRTISLIREKAGFINETRLPYLESAEENNLWLIVKKLALKKLKLLLIFDQFEEIQSFPVEEINNFKKALAEVFSSDIPLPVYNQIRKNTADILKKSSLSEKERKEHNDNLQFYEEPLEAKALFVVREDKLGTMSLLGDYFPDILKNDFVLKALTIENARKAIVEPAAIKGDFISAPFIFEETGRVLTEIADNDSQLVDPIQIQIICSNIERNKVIGQNKIRITTSDIPPISDIINDFYANSWDRVKITVNLTEKDLDIKRKQVAGELVVNDRRNLVHAGRLIKAETRESDKKIVDILIDAGLIREHSTGPDDVFYQLCHDRFIKSVNKDILRLQEKIDLEIKLEEKKRIQAEIVIQDKEDVAKIQEDETKKLSEWERIEKGEAKYRTSAEVKLEIINKAREVIRGNRSMNFDELRQLCKDLEKLDQFAYATEILLRIIKEEEAEGKTVPLRNYQTLAKYIYKDNSLPSSFKFDKALHELNTHDNLLETGKCESLGLAGAIYKRKWQFDHQFKNLALSQYHYKRGFEIWRFFIAQQSIDKSLVNENNDDGYTAINYAYLCELMAVDKLEEFGEFSDLASDYENNLAEAEEARKYIIKEFIKDSGSTNPELKQVGRENTWIIATVAEAYFGLRNYEAALKFIIQYVNFQGLNQWEIRSFSQQLFSLAYLQLFQKKFFENPAITSSSAYQPLKDLKGLTTEKRINACLKVFLGKQGSAETDDVNVEVKKDGKLGLALSGGGFRASLFHIGVLASLAENNELKNVDIISCVSGGSIIGAYYYLKLKELLEDKMDNDIQKEDYINIVKLIEKDFVAGVQKNLRMRIFSNPFANFKMLFSKNYSRSHRIGELYDKYFYKPLTGKDNVYMNDLIIRPKLKEGEIFSFLTDNWKRKHKIPQLVLNATSVNTGHNWQFTASWMGEPPGNIQVDIDVKPRLRRMYYEEAPPKYRKFRLGYAVGASACVPVMFHPMPFPDLYSGIDLQLIDGGLHDNQGIAALIEQECKNMIISDASGQMPTNEVATHNAAAVFYRADTILQERIRELQFMDIKERNYTAQLNSLIAVHLKNGLKSYPVSWMYCIDPTRSILYENEIKLNEDLLQYGILRDMQKLLSEIRTDLDSFSDVEACSLIYSGYMQTNYELSKKQHLLPNQEWNFMRIKRSLTIPAEAEKIKKILSVGRKLAFKVIDLSTPAKAGVITLAAIVSIPFMWLLVKFYYKSIYSLDVTGKVIISCIITIVLAYIFTALARFVNYKSTIARYITLSFILLSGFIISNIYLLLFNRMYNNAGKLRETDKQAQTENP